MAQMVFDKVAGKRAGNYSSNPNVNVEVLERPRHCAGCAKLGQVAELVWDPKGGLYGGAWVHAEGGPKCLYAQPEDYCRFCGAEGAAEGVRFRQHAWYDAVECARCGGVDGFALGD